MLLTSKTIEKLATDFSETILLQIFENAFAQRPAMAVIQNNWSDRQREIIWEFDKNKGSQSECAERMKISQSSVQRSLVNGNYYAYKEAKDTVNSVLREIGEVRV